MIVLSVHIIRSGSMCRWNYIKFSNKKWLRQDLNLRQWRLQPKCSALDHSATESCQKACASFTIINYYLYITRTCESQQASTTSILHGHVNPNKPGEKNDRNSTLLSLRRFYQKQFYHFWRLNVVKLSFVGGNFPIFCFDEHQSLWYHFLTNYLSLSLYRDR